jgi:hypothetical protein
MQRLYAFLLLSLYLLSSVGISITAHYCGGSLASVAIIEQASCCCDDEQNGMPDDCCTNDVKVLKLAEDQLKAEQRLFVLQDVDALLPLLCHYVSPASSLSATLIITDIVLPDPPERDNSLPVYKRNHSLLLYS